MDEEINVFDNGHHLPIGQDAGGHHTSNWQYLILISIVRDMINNSLINHLDLFDILNDYDVLCYSTGQKHLLENQFQDYFLKKIMFNIFVQMIMLMEIKAVILIEQIYINFYSIIKHI